MRSREDWAGIVRAVAERRDRAAFAEAYDAFAPRLAAYLQRLGTDPDLAAEIAQDTLTVLWHKAALFDAEKASLGTWLFRIARNRRIDLSRRDREVALDMQAAAEIASDAPSADTMIAGEQQAALVRRALAELPEEQASLVKLAFYEFLSHSEIAARTGLPLGTIKSRIRLAFARLKRALEAGGVTGSSEG